MGILSLLALCMVFAMDSRPFFGHLTRGEPQPQTEKMRWERMQV
jgi:hypothetical protein